MKLLFVSMSARTIEDSSGNIYLNSHMNRKTIKRYADICDEFRMILRDSGIRCDEEEAKHKYDLFPYDLAQLDIGFNPYNPKTNLIKVKKYKELEHLIENDILWADRVILASAVGVYSEIAIKYCRKYHRQYMLMVGGFAYETDWNHGIDGKIVAWKHERTCKKNMADAPYGLYVTQRSLQERYPCTGKTIGCSDVEIIDLSPSFLEERLKKMTSGKGILSLGTAANIDDKRKGHRFVIKAISLLKLKGHRFEYHLLGNGRGEELLSYARQCGVENQVIIDGSKPHNEVYGWLDSIDIYIQPSFTEGLCRAVVEAMSRACPVVCTNVGGNSELCSNEYLVKPGDSEGIAKALESLISPDERKKQAQISFEKAHDYYSETLDQKRQEFLLDFMK